MGPQTLAIPRSHGGNLFYLVRSLTMSIVGTYTYLLYVCYFGAILSFTSQNGFTCRMSLRY